MWRRVLVLGKSSTPYSSRAATYSPDISPELRSISSSYPPQVRFHLYILTPSTLPSLPNASRSQFRKVRMTGPIPSTRHVGNRRPNTPPPIADAADENTRVWVLPWSLHCRRPRRLTASFRLRSSIISAGGGIHSVLPYKLLLRRLTRHMFAASCRVIVRHPSTCTPPGIIMWCNGHRTI